MRDHFIEQQQRREARHLGDQPGMGQHEADEERLLLAGRGVGGGDAFRAMHDVEVGEMRPGERAPGRGVARAALAKLAAIAVLDRDRGLLHEHRLHPAVERDLGPGKRRVRVLAGIERALQAAHRLGAPGRDRDPDLGGLVLDRVEPVRIGPRLFEQPVARAQRALQRVDAAHVLRVDREHQPVEETAPFGRRSCEQLIHLRRQPHDAQVIGEGRGGADRLPVDAALAQRAFLGAGLDAGAERRQPERAFDLGRHRPRAVALIVGDIVERRAAQAASGRQKRDRLDAIGLAGAVRADQHHRPVRSMDARGAVAAEIGQRQAADQGGGMGSYPLPLWERVAPKAPGEGSFLIVQIGKDVFENALRTLEHVVIPITENTEAFCPKERVPDGIPLRRRVLTSVDFNDDFRLETRKVQYEVPEGHLPPKLEPDKTPIAQHVPHCSFGIGRFMAHMSRKSANCLDDRTMMRVIRHGPLTRLPALATLSHKGRG